MFIYVYWPWSYLRSIPVLAAPFKRETPITSCSAVIVSSPESPCTMSNLAKLSVLFRQPSLLESQGFRKRWDIAARYWTTNWSYVPEESVHPQNKNVQHFTNRHAFFVYPETFYSIKVGFPHFTILRQPPRLPKPDQNTHKPQNSHCINKWIRRFSRSPKCKALGSAICKSIAANQFTISGSLILTTGPVERSAPLLSRIERSS